MITISSVVDKAMFPGTYPSYDAASFNELFYIPLPDNVDKFEKIPCILLPYINGSRYLIIYAHGNGIDIGDIVDRLTLLSNHIKVHILAFDYPGYGCFKGKANMTNVDLCMDTVLKFVEVNLHWPLENVILYGCSIGTGPCTRYAKRIASNYSQPVTTKCVRRPVYLKNNQYLKNPVLNVIVMECISKNNAPIKSENSKYLLSFQNYQDSKKLGGLILQCPYRSIRHAAEKFIGSLMAKVLVQSRWNIEQEIESCACPILWIHGKKDELFDWKGSEYMYTKYKFPLKMIHLPERATHFNFDFVTDIVEPIRVFISTMVSQSSKNLQYLPQLMPTTIPRLIPLFSLVPVPVIPMDSYPKMHDIYFSYYDKHLGKTEPIDYSILCDFDNENPFFRKRSFMHMNTTDRLNGTRWINNIIDTSDFKNDSTYNMEKPKKYFNSYYNIENKCDKNLLENETTPTEKKNNIYNFLFSQFHKNCNESKYNFIFQKALYKALVKFLESLNNEITLQNIKFTENDFYFKAVQWVKRIYACRFNHNLGVDIVYKRNKLQKTNSTSAVGVETNNLSNWTIFGLVIFGQLFRLSDSDTPTPLGKRYLKGINFFGIIQNFNTLLNDTINSTKTDSNEKITREFIYSSLDFLIFPIYVAPKLYLDFVYRWFLTIIIEKLSISKNSSWFTRIPVYTVISKENTTPITKQPLPVKNNRNLENDDLLKNINLVESCPHVTPLVKNLYLLCSSYSNFFFKVKYRPYIERSTDRLGNFFFFGWDQFIQHFIKHWNIFEPRFFLKSSQYLYCENPSKKSYETKTILSEQESFFFSRWKVSGWKLLRNWYSPELQSPLFLNNRKNSKIKTHTMYDRNLSSESYDMVKHKFFDSKSLSLSMRHRKIETNSLNLMHPSSELSNDYNVHNPVNLASLLLEQFISSNVISIRKKHLIFDKSVLETSFKNLLRIFEKNCLCYDYYVLKERFSLKLDELDELVDFSKKLDNLPRVMKIPKASKGRTTYIENNDLFTLLSTHSAIYCEPTINFDAIDELTLHAESVMIKLDTRLGGSYYKDNELINNLSEYEIKSILDFSPTFHPINTECLNVNSVQPNTSRSTTKDHFGVYLNSQNKSNNNQTILFQHILRDRYQYISECELYDSFYYNKQMVGFHSNSNSKMIHNLCFNNNYNNNSEYLTPSICYHPFIFNFLLKSGPVSIEFLSSLDSLWKLIEMITGLKSSVNSNQFNLQTFRENTTCDNDSTKENYAIPLVIQINLCVAVMLIRRFLALSRNLYLNSVKNNVLSLPVLTDIGLSQSYIDKYVGLVNPCVRFLDELRFFFIRKYDLYPTKNCCEKYNTLNRNKNAIEVKDVESNNSKIVNDKNNQEFLTQEKLDNYSSKIIENSVINTVSDTSTSNTVSKKESSHHDNDNDNPVLDSYKQIKNKDVDVVSVNDLPNIDPLKFNQSQLPIFTDNKLPLFYEQNALNWDNGSFAELGSCLLVVQLENLLVFLLDLLELIDSDFSKNIPNIINDYELDPSMNEFPIQDQMNLAYIFNKHEKVLHNRIIKNFFQITNINEFL